MARDILLGYLAELGCPDGTDEAVMEYASGVLQSMIEEEDDEDESLSHLDTLLAGACGRPYEAHTETERLVRLAMKVHEARAAPPKPNTHSVLQLAKDAGALASQLRATTLSSRGGRSTGENSSSTENVPPADKAYGSRCAPAVIQELQVLCSRAVSEEFLQYALERNFHGNAEALAAWLLDSDRSELQGAEAQWQELRQRELQDEEAARLLKERNKQLILQKFDLRPVPESKDPKKVGKGGPQFDVWTGKQQAQQSKVRYLDGRVVSTKGEKFVTEKAGEEWDGGSRGKVYTKGKRGKGFV